MKEGTGMGKGDAARALELERRIMDIISTEAADADEDELAGQYGRICAAVEAGGKDGDGPPQVLAAWEERAIAGMSLNGLPIKNGSLHALSEGDVLTATAKAGKAYWRSVFHGQPAGEGEALSATMQGEPWEPGEIAIGAYPGWPEETEGRPPRLYVTLRGGCRHLALSAGDMPAGDGAAGREGAKN